MAASIIKVVKDMAERKGSYAEMEYLDIVKQMVEEIKFGQIAIIVQDGKVVQIEENKKIRLKN